MVCVALSILGVAAVALFLSTVTDSLSAAATGALTFLITSSSVFTLDAAAR